MSICGNCRFYRSLTGDQGHCRRNPPTVITVTSSNPKHGLQPETAWPVVDSGAWCGEWGSN